MFFGGFFNNTSISVISASELNGTNGFMITYTDDTSNDDATFVECLGDINNDGTDEIGIGASFTDAVYDIDNSGVFYVIYGNSYKYHLLLIDCDSLSSDVGFKIYEDQRCKKSLGFQFAKLGDINNDKYSDFIITCSPNIVFIVLGRAIFPKEVNLSFLTNSFQFDGNITFTDGKFGLKVAGNFDINNDGFKDILIGALDFINYPLIFIIFGSGNFDNNTLNFYNFNNNLSFLIRGETNLTVNDNIFSFSYASDYNTDDIDDIIIVHKAYNDYSGKIYIIYGNLHPSNLNLSNSLINGSFEINLSLSQILSIFSIRLMKVVRLT